jgi:hypothetical protein
MPAARRAAAIQRIKCGRKIKARTGRRAIRALCCARARRGDSIARRLSGPPPAPFTNRTIAKKRHRRGRPSARRAARIPLKACTGRRAYAHFAAPAAPARAAATYASATRQTSFATKSTNNGLMHCSTCPRRKWRRRDIVDREESIGEARRGTPQRSRASDPLRCSLPSRRPGVRGATCIELLRT